MLKNAKSKKQIVKENNDNKKFILYNRPYTFFKPNYNSIIPLKIFQTWYTKDLPPKMKTRVEILKRQNPRFEHFLFDDNDCREFIRTKFPSDVLNAYDSLIPGAYKADLWRLCVLYIHGGIYMDIKLVCVNGFKLIELTEANHFIKDRLAPLSIFNSCMVCQQNHPYLLIAINKIVENVKSKVYGSSPLDPTGPALLAKYFTSEEKNAFDIKHRLYGINDGDKYIKFNDNLILKCYSGYFSERKSSTIKHYAELWNNRRVYL